MIFLSMLTIVLFLFTNDPPLSGTSGGAFSRSLLLTEGTGINLTDARTISAVFLDENDVPDLIVTEPSWDGGRGRVLIHWNMDNTTLTHITSRGPHHGFGSYAEATDLEQDGTADLLIGNSEGSIYMIEGAIGPHNNVSVGPDNLVFEKLDGIVHARNGAYPGDIAVTHLDPGNGTLEFYYTGRLNAPGLEFEVNVSSTGSIDSEGDLDGNGIPEVVVVCTGSTGSDIYILDQQNTSQLHADHLPYTVCGMDCGDLNGDGMDDIVLLSNDSALNGMIIAAMGSENITSILKRPMTDLIEGTINTAIGCQTDLFLSDLDLKGKCDVVTSDPFRGGSAGNISYFLDPFDKGLPVPIDGPTGYVEGTSSLRGIGTHTVPGVDLDGDLLPDILYSEGEELLAWFPLSNSQPAGPLEMRISRLTGPDDIDQAQVGETLLITVGAQDSDPSARDILGIKVKTGTGSTELYGVETDMDSGIFTCVVKVANRTFPGRMIGCSIPDVMIFLIDGEVIREIAVRGTLGLDDPPILEGLPEKLRLYSGNQVAVEFSAVDPDGDEVNVSLRGQPDWLELKDDILYGVPTANDTGEGTFSIVVESTVHTVNRTVWYNVSLLKPVLLPVSLPGYVDEGKNYSADLLISGLTDSTVISLDLDGPNRYEWLSMDRQGHVRGKTNNSHVGQWTVNISIVNPGGLTSGVEWNVIVNNVLPDLNYDWAGSITQGQTFLLDLGSSDEGDGYTTYSIVNGPPGLSIHPVAGLMEWLPDDRHVGEWEINFRVHDGHGGFVNGSVSLRVLNIPPNLTTFPPASFYAWSEMWGGIESSDEPFVEYRLVPTIDHLAIDPVTGDISCRFWNEDSGFYNSTLHVLDINGAEIEYNWSFEVLANTTILDPRLNASFIEEKEGSILIDVGLSRDDLYPADLTVYLADGKGENTSRFFTGWNGSPVWIDAVNMTGPVEVHLEVSLMGHNLSADVELILGDDGSNGKGAPFCLLFLLPMILILLGVSVFLFTTERTSFTLLRSFFPSDGRDGKEVVNVIQSRPGLRYRDLAGSIGLSKRELIRALNELEGSGDVRVVEDGMKVRFYPTVGSFVDGPLSLNKKEVQLLDVIFREGPLTVGSLEERTGIPARSIGRMLAVLDLKGLVSEKGDPASYYLTRRQKATFERLMK